MRPREKATVRQRLLAVLSAAAVVAAVAGFAGSPAAGAQPGLFSGESICAALFGFAAEPVPVVKSADGETVLASVEWGYNADHNLCYLVLDAAAVQTLRANPPTPTALPPTDTDRSAAARCHNAYNPDRGFASEPVPVVKSADGQTVLASVKWGYNPTHTLCYLILDDAAQQALLDHHPCASNNSSPACPAPQPTTDAGGQGTRQALIALYDATGGPNWTNNTNWNTDRPLDTWHGVRTDANGKVTIVDLRDNGLTGIIPEEIGNLTSLTHLNLSNNALTGTIPPQLGNLTSLTGIYLWANNLHGPIPLSFTALTELEHFYTPANNAICLPNNLRAWHNNIENKTPLPNCDNPETTAPPGPCSSPEPTGEHGVGIGSDGRPCATVLLSRDDLATTVIGEQVADWLMPADPETGMPEWEALGHITECLRESAKWGTEDDPFPYARRSGWGRVPADLTALEQCSYVWHLASVPIAYAGMRPAAACVWETYHLVHLYGSFAIIEKYHPGGSGPESAHYGWAEHCDVWFDPDWTMGWAEKCARLHDHYTAALDLPGGAARVSQCSQVSEFGPEWEAWFQRRGACGHRYHLVAMAAGLWHREARELGLLPADGPVDHMRRLPDGWKSWC